MIKKLFLFMLILVLILPTVKDVKAASDVTPIKLLNTSINQTEAKIGDTIVMTFEVAPDLESGFSEDPQDFLISLKGETGGEIPTLLDYIGNNKYELRWKIAENTLKGRWYIDYVSFADKAGNRSYYHSNDPLISKLNYYVTNGISDTNPAVLNGLKIETPIVKPNEQMKVRLDVTDESGQVEGSVIFRHKETGDYIHAFFYGSTKDCTGVLTVPENMKNGIWEVYYVRITDKYGNFKNYLPEDYPFFKGKYFEVTGGNSDFKVPEFISASLSQSSIYLGDSFTAYVNAKDNETGIQQVSISFTNKITGASFWEIMNYNYSLKLYEAHFRVGLNQPIGDYQIDQITLTDKADNTGFIFPYSPNVQLPELNVKSVFEGVDPLVVTRGTNFSPLDSVKAYSSYEGDLTNQIKIDGNIDPNTNGIYLLKYRVDSTKQNYTYEEYRWISVNDANQTIDQDTVFYNSDIKVGVPSESSVILKNGANQSVLSSTTNISKEGPYELTVNSGSSTRSNSSSSIMASSLSGGFSSMKITPFSMNNVSVSNLKTMNGKFKFVIDKTAPRLDSISQVTDQSTSITGKTEPYSTVNLSINNQYIKSVRSNKYGDYTIPVTKQSVNSEIKITAKDKAKNVSKPKIMKVVHKPIINSVSNLNTVISGKSIIGSKLQLFVNGKFIKTATTDSNGVFKFQTKRLTAGTVIKIVSNSTTKITSVPSTIKVIDKAAPVKPIVNSIDSSSTKISGKAEKGSTVSIYKDNSKFLTKIKSSSTGTFKTTILKQKKGSRLYFYAIDAAGNKSKPAIVIVK